ncbi:hypothetical protein ABZS66_14020 [Dactylosporangium sp. NPDC005572]|uniref:hypothetical protein n=1 Tax=Dactylosporangium sp. NPDC005572 TaxID=3156889 RepID=UPI0033AC1C8A
MSGPRSVLLNPRVLAGWLFADLLAAFVLIVMGSHITAPDPLAAAASPSASASASLPASPSASPSAAPSPSGPPGGLESEPIAIELPNTASVETIRQAIVASGKAQLLQGRRAGMVLTFGKGGLATGNAEAHQVNAKLPAVYPDLFGGNTVFRDFITTRDVTNIEIFLIAR